MKRRCFERLFLFCFILKPNFDVIFKYLLQIIVKKYLKSIYQNSNIGYYVLWPFTRIYQFKLHKKYLQRETFVKQKFKNAFGYELDLKNPETLNEKINWLKLNFWHPRATQLADKYAVRQYVAETIGEQFLIPLLFTSENYREIKPRNLPNIPCIIKTNHDSFGGIIIYNKNDNHNWKEIQNRLRARMSQNFYWDGRERQYKNIIPRIIVEKLLTNESRALPADYKVHCFNGKVRMINVDMGRSTENHHRNWYNRDWVREPYSWSSVLADGKYTDPSEEEFDRPELLEEMCRLSEELVNGFPYLRADWYIYKNQLYFGELTLHHNGGNRPILPAIWDTHLGNELILPNI